MIRLIKLLIAEFRLVMYDPYKSLHVPNHKPSKAKLRKLERLIEDVRKLER